MKNIILVHGFNGIPKIYEWLKAELESRNLEVILPSFPPQEGVVYEAWAEILDKYKDHITSDSIIICHSIGNEFIIKYLTNNNLPVSTYIGLAGFAQAFYNEGKDILNVATEKFLVTSEEKQQFIDLATKRYAIYSNDDHIVPFDVLSAYPKEIAAEPILIPGIGHMGRKSGMEKFPELLELVLENLRPAQDAVSCNCAHDIIQPKTTPQ